MVLVIKVWKGLRRETWPFFVVVNLKRQNGGIAESNYKKQ